MNPFHHSIHAAFLRLRARLEHDVAHLKNNQPISAMTNHDHLRQRFGAFYASHGDNLFRYARGRCGTDDAGLDLLQDALVKGWEWLLKHPQATEEDLRPVMHTIIFHTAIDGARRRNRNPIDLAGDTESEESTSILDCVAADEPLPDELAALPDLSKQIEQAVQRVKNSTLRKLLELYYFSDAPPLLKQIADELGIKASSVNTYHRRALQALKTSLLSLAQEMNIIPSKA